MQIEIERFTLKGYGIGFLPDGKEVEIPHAVPGDFLLIDYKKKRHPPQKGRLLEILQPSPERVVPRCPHTRICGGCCWQEMAYTSQLKEKESRVKKAFKNRYPVDPIIPAPATFGYRNKMEFSFSENRAGTQFLGLMIAAAEPYVFNVEQCHLGPSWYTDAIHAVRSWWAASGLKAYFPPADSGTLRYLTLRQGMRTNQKMAILNVSESLNTDSFVSALRAIADPISIFLRVHQTQKGTPTQFYECHLHGPDHIMEELHLKTGNISVKISPASFFQPNTLQAEILYDTALSALRPNSTVYDLYCGTGTLTLAASRSAKQVIGIELSPEAILDAEENCRRNSITNATFYQGDVGQTLTRLSTLPRPDAVIVDPPRAGLDPLALHHLKTLLPRQIIYISCNPLTQAANVEELIQAGYHLVRLQPLDQFPHTYHIENIAFLER